MLRVVHISMGDRIKSVFVISTAGRNLSFCSDFSVALLLRNDKNDSSYSFRGINSVLRNISYSDRAENISKSISDYSVIEAMACAAAACSASFLFFPVPRPINSSPK